ncbi:MAG: response regulator transcription factor [Oscillospiraceae bacterium]|nr:response regulator transcription factor [Oscillospiraceae bacterium]
MSKVLIVEDEQAIVEILNFNLQKEGYETAQALDGLEGLNAARELDPDLILLDVMLPGMNGFDICRTLREEGRTVPILMLTAREEEADKVLGLETGADDYITKPFSMRELLARVKANIRRRALDAPAVAAQKDGLYVDTANYAVYKNGVKLDLTQKEYDLVCFLVQSPDKVYSREELLEKVWNYDYFGDTRTVDVMIRRLREKLEDDSANPRYIMTRRGVGYYFNAGGQA